MPAALVYPASLPVPAVAPIQSAERRVLSDLEAREFQRDRLAYQSVTFPPFNAEQQEIFDNWWKTDLLKGGKWFSATWPLPEGWVVGVRRFIGTPRWEFIPSPTGMMRVTAEFEVRGVGRPPVQYIAPLLAMHFDEDFTDLSGHTIAPYHWVSFAGSPVIGTADPIMGTGYMYGASGDVPEPLLSDIRGPLNLNQYGEWQISFWVRPLTSIYGYSGGGVVTLQGASEAGGSIPGTPGGDSAQIVVRVDAAGGEPTGFISLRVSYNGRNAGNPSMNASVSMTEIVPALVPLDDEPHFIAVCGDSTSTRAYIDDTLVLDDHITDSYPAGSQPLWYDPGSSFENQVFIVGALFGGGMSEGDTWPTNSVFTKWFYGSIDDLLVKNGPGSVDYTGSTITPPTSPFVIGGI